MGYILIRLESYLSILDTANHQVCVCIGDVHGFWYNKIFLIILVVEKQMDIPNVKILLGPSPHTDAFLIISMTCPWF